MFFSWSFASDGSSYTELGGHGTTVNYVEIKDVIVDEFYACHGSTLMIPNEEKVMTQYDLESYHTPNDVYWGRDTAIHAQFNGDAFGGNIKIKPEEVKSIKIKRRRKGDFAWQTFYMRDVDLNEQDPFNVFMMDYLEPSETDIEYTYSFSKYVIDEEGNNTGVIDVDAVVQDVRSEFDNYFIIGAEIDDDNEVHNTVYQAMANANTIPNYNRASNTIVSPGSKYPYIVNNGIAKYYSGTFSAVFFHIEDCCRIEEEDSYKLRNQIDEFLTDGNVKILKKFNGDLWMINVVGDIKRNDEGHWNYISQSFDWAEAGNVRSITDLYDNAFINTDIDRE